VWKLPGITMPAVNQLRFLQRLVDFPESGRIVPELGIANLREIIHPPFRIVYRLDSNKIRFVRVCRSERLLKLP
jgi:plasmid stabilization system protein ParE